MARTGGEPAAVETGWPVSVKGVVGWDGRYVVLRNRRGEWELPGGRLEPTDVDLPAAVRRELREELGLDVAVGWPVDTWIYDVADRRVVIVSYHCTAPRPEQLTISDEHTDVGLLTLDELRRSIIPAGYLRTIETVVSVGSPLGSVEAGPGGAAR
jgi:8-oxo-dGTP pyrophosphatase MutT (NUDIX family)